MRASLRHCCGCCTPTTTSSRRRAHRSEPPPRSSPEWPSSSTSTSASPGPRPPGTPRRPARASHPGARRPPAPSAESSARDPPEGRSRPATGAPSRAAGCARPPAQGWRAMWRRLIAISSGRPVRRSTLSSPSRVRIRPESRMGRLPRASAEVLGVEPVVGRAQPVQQQQVAGTRPLAAERPGGAGACCSTGKARNSRSATRRTARGSRGRESGRSPASTAVGREGVAAVQPQHARGAPRLTMTVRLVWVTIRATAAKAQHAQAVGQATDRWVSSSLTVPDPLRPPTPRPWPGRPARTRRRRSAGTAGSRAASGNAGCAPRPDRW